MKIEKTAKKLVTCVAVIGVASGSFSQSTHAQFVKRKIFRQSFISREYRPRWYERYENFGTHNLRGFPEPVKYEEKVGNPVHRGYVTPLSYDKFGNYLLPGGEIYSMVWNKSRVGASEGYDDEWIGGIFNNLVISADEFSNWQTRFMIARTWEIEERWRVPLVGWQTRKRTAGGLRAFFTSSTLKSTNFEGFRWDASSRKNNITILASSDFYTPIGDKNPRDKRPLYGVHWQTVLGDILKVGATFVSQKRGTIAYSHQDIDRDIKADAPQYLYVLITDDSPEDSGPGAMVYDIKVMVNGKQKPIAFHGEPYDVQGRVFKIANVLNKTRFYKGKFQNIYTFRDEDVSNSPYIQRDIAEVRNSRDSWFLNLMSSKRILHDFFHKSTEIGSAGYLSITKESQPDDPFGLWPASRHYPDRIVVNPEETDPSKINSEYTRYFMADMSRGYVEAKGSDVIVYEIQVPSRTKDVAFNVLVSNDYCIDIIAPLYTWRQDGWGNWYDEPLTDKWDTQWSIYEYDKKHCAKAPGNVKDKSNMKWVKIRYDRITGMNVYGINMELNWQGLFIRAEYNENNTLWSYPLRENIRGGKRTDYSSRAWFINAEKDFGKWGIGTELFNYPNEYMQYWPTIDDNDDDDGYAGRWDNGKRMDEYPGSYEMVAVHLSACTPHKTRDLYYWK